MHSYYSIRGGGFNVAVEYQTSKPKLAGLNVLSPICLRSWFTPSCWERQLKLARHKSYVFFTVHPT